MLLLCLLPWTRGPELALAGRLELALAGGLELALVGLFKLAWTELLKSIQTGILGSTWPRDVAGVTHAACALPA